MPTAKINPDRFVKIRYSRVKRGILGIKIEAARAIDIYSVPESQYDRWRNKREYEGAIGHLRRRSVNFEVNSGPEFNEPWYLILENHNDSEVRADYEVYER